MVKNNGKTYYLLTYNLQKSLTSKYFDLVGEKFPTLTSNRKPLFLFNEKKQWANNLKEGAVYLVEYNTHDKDKKTKYLHVKDWNILGDKLSIERSWNILKANGRKH